jgi:hypothetical protein
MPEERTGLFVLGGELKDKFKGMDIESYRGDGAFYFMGVLSDDNEILISSDLEYRVRGASEWKKVVDLFPENFRVTVI